MDVPADSGYYDYKIYKLTNKDDTVSNSIYFLVIYISSGVSNVKFTNLVYNTRKYGLSSALTSYSPTKIYYGSANKGEFYITKYGETGSMGDYKLHVYTGGGYTEQRRYIGQSFLITQDYKGNSGGFVYTPALFVLYKYPNGTYADATGVIPRINITPSNAYKENQYGLYTINGADKTASNYIETGLSVFINDIGCIISSTIISSDEQSNIIGNYLENNYIPIDLHDPNPGGGDSTPGGGGGDGDIGGDTNPDDGLPTISALDSGLLTAYNPTVAELQSLGRFLWSDSFDVSTFKKLFNDPFDTLLGLSVVPVKPNTSGTKSIMFGNMDSGVSAPVVSNQWVSKDMGSVTLNEVWRGALDYAPSTGVTIYLPFIGMRQLNVNDVMGSSLHLIYKFDVLTGACVAQIYVNHNHQGNKNSGFSWHKDQGLVYEFIGQCAENIPLASQDFTNTIRAAIGGVSVAAGAAASVATGNPALGMAALTVGMANSGMQASTPTVERGGHLSGSASILGYSQPFLIVERPHQCKPERYYALRGVPSQVYTSKLSKCTGFTQITANNNLHIAGASDSELAELQNLLVAGVYFPDKKR